MAWYRRCRADARGRRWYADPLFKGQYPAEVLQELGADAPVVLPGDMDCMASPLDFLGINYYSRAILRSTTVAEAENEPRTIAEPGPEARTDIGWEVYPEGLATLLRRLAADLPGLPLVITENGASCSILVGKPSLSSSESSTF